MFTLSVELSVVVIVELVSVGVVVVEVVGVGVVDEVNVLSFEVESTYRYTIEPV